MRYYQLLDKAINRSGLILKEITEACIRHGVSIDPTHISKIRSNVYGPPPEPEPGDISPSKNAALAKVLGLDELTFRLAAALEHTPSLVIQSLFDPQVSDTLKAIGKDVYAARTGVDPEPVSIPGGDDEEALIAKLAAVSGLRTTQLKAMVEALKR